MSSRLGRGASGHVWALHRSWVQIVSRETASQPKQLTQPFMRQASIFREISRRVKGEIESNSELQKSIKEFKEKAGDIKSRTKETTEQLYKQVDAAREEAETRARQVSAAVKEKVRGATEQVKESVGGIKFGSTQISDASTRASESASGSTTSVRPEPAEASRASNSEAGEKARGAAESSTGAALEDFLSKVSQGFHSATAFGGATFRRVRDTRILDMVRNAYTFLRLELSSTAPRRKSKPAVDPASAPTENTTVTAIVPVVKKTTGWERRWETLKQKARAHPAFKRLRTVKQHPVVAKSQELAEDLRERWETSDSPVVQKIQGINESIFGETATAVAMREIRRRDPSFSYAEFTMEVQEGIRPVLQAYLKVVERCRGERRALESQGIFLDNKILHIFDVYVKETRLLGNSPIIIVTFQTQQIYCARDKHGNITDGAKDNIQTVYYSWAMQQSGPDEMEEEDLHPHWKLREMQQLGMKAII